MPAPFPNRPVLRAYYVMYSYLGGVPASSNIQFFIAAPLTTAARVPAYQVNKTWGGATDFGTLSQASQILYPPSVIDTGNSGVWVNNINGWGMTGSGQTPVNYSAYRLGMTDPNGTPLDVFGRAIPFTVRNEQNEQTTLGALNVRSLQTSPLYVPQGGSLLLALDNSSAATTQSSYIYGAVEYQYAIENQQPPAVSQKVDPSKMF